MLKCTNCRRAGVKLFLKGDRCNSPKCAITKRNYRPGSHGPKQLNLRKSEYGLQLFEKQKMKAEYGLREKQFANIFERASKSRGNTSEELLKLLEMRFDNLVYRSGLAASRSDARQKITHRKFNINNKLVSIPSYQLRPKDIISPVKPESINLVKVNVPKWVKFDPKAKKAEVVNLPKLEDVGSDIDTQLIIEYYSR